MRKFVTFIFIVLPFAVFAYASPGKPIGFVNDFANVINAENRQAIETKLQSLQDSTGAQVAVVTINSLDGDTVENFAVQLFQEWGIGKEDKDNGLLILVAPNEREARIEVGYGLEGDITDLQSGLIVRNVMIPAFREGDYSKGVGEAVNALSAIILKSPEAAQYLEDINSNASGVQSSGLKVNFAVLFFFAVIILNTLARILGKTKSWWLGGVLGAGIGAIVGLIFGFLYVGAISIVILSILGFVFDYFVSKKPPGSGRGPGFWFFGPGGHGGSGGFGGGFGGFGGGMSGGGGTSGRW